jgi:hypothetical protein
VLGAERRRRLLLGVRSKPTPLADFPGVALLQLLTLLSLSAQLSLLLALPRSALRFRSRDLLVSDRDLLVSDPRLSGAILSG